MDDGEIDFSNRQVFAEVPTSCSMDMFFDELLRDTHACTHTHTCNPPGPDSSHTHTCLHVHTKIVPAESDEKVSADDTAESSDKNSKKRPSANNREAVRKYREKKKAKAASLEDEVTRLRSINQQLLKRIQGQAALEAEVARLKCLLVDIRGRIEGEIGSFPYQKPANEILSAANFPGSYVMNPCNANTGVDGRSSEGLFTNGVGFGGCDVEQLHCLAYQSGNLGDFACGDGNGSTETIGSGANKRSGTTRSRTKDKSLF